MRTFNTLQDLKESRLKADGNQVVYVKGLDTLGDGYGAYYLIKNSTTTVDDLITHRIANGNVAERQVNKFLESSDNTSLGFGLYRDTQYTSSSPFIVTSGTKVTLPNNAGEVIDTNLPIHRTDLYNGSVLTAERLNDTYIWNIRMTIEPSASNAGLGLSIDIGGTQNEFVADSRRLVRGTSATEVSIPLSGFTGQTFIDNGGTVKILAEDGDLSIYGIVYYLVCTGKGR